MTRTEKENRVPVWERITISANIAAIMTRVVMICGVMLGILLFFFTVHRFLGTYMAVSILSPLKPLLHDSRRISVRVLCSYDYKAPQKILLYYRFANVLQKTLDYFTSFREYIKGFIF